MVELLVTRGGEVNARDNDNCTALHGAVLTSNAQIVAALLKAGADKNIRGYIMPPRPATCYFATPAQIAELILKSITPLWLRSGGRQTAASPRWGQAKL